MAGRSSIISSVVYQDQGAALKWLEEAFGFEVAMMIEDSHVDTRVIDYRVRNADSGFTGRGAGPLLAVALTDVLSDGLSMVYSFYDPEQVEREPKWQYEVLHDQPTGAGQQEHNVLDNLQI